MLRFRVFLNAFSMRFRCVLFFYVFPRFFFIRFVCVCVFFCVLLDVFSMDSRVLFACTWCVLPRDLMRFPWDFGAPPKKKKKCLRSEHAGDEHVVGVRLCRWRPGGALAGAQPIGCRLAPRSGKELCAFAVFLS